MDKANLKSEFADCGAINKWLPTYDLDVMTYSMVLDDCLVRADRLRPADDLTCGEIAFIAMVDGWE